MELMFVVGDALSPSLPVRGEARGVTRTLNLSAWYKQIHLAHEEGLLKFMCFLILHKLTRYKSK